MKVFQLKLKVYLLASIPISYLQPKISALIDHTLGQNEEMSQFHRQNKYKMYTYDMLYPLEKDKVHKEDKIYSFTIRTIDPTVAKFFDNRLPKAYTEEMKVLSGKMQTIPERMIDTLYSLTPVVMKDSFGYWRTNLTVEQFEDRLKVNLIKKYNYYFNEIIDEDFELYNQIEFLNSRPIPIPYKNIVLLGDKIKLHIAENPTAQKLAHMSLGTGLLENNARGAGFVNYQWHK